MSDEIPTNKSKEEIANLEAMLRVGVEEITILSNDLEKKASLYTIEKESVDKLTAGLQEMRKQEIVDLDEYVTLRNLILENKEMYVLAEKSYKEAQQKHKEYDELITGLKAEIDRVTNLKPESEKSNIIQFPIRYEPRTNQIET